MDEQTERLKLPIVETSQSTNSPVYLLISGLFIAAALVFAGVGWYTVYNDTYNARIVGGDAYNFIIYATRGTALVCVGIVCAVLSVTFSIFAHTARKN
jgi:hypothetical protein